MTLKRKIPIAIVLLVALSVLSTQLVVYYFSRDIIMKETESKVSVNSEKTALYVDGLVQGELTTTKLVSGHNTFKDLLSMRYGKSDAEFFSPNNELLSKANEILKTSFENVNEHEHFFIIDKSGLIIADSVAENIGKTNLADRSYFKEAMAGKDAISDTIVSKINGKIVIVFATPIKDKSGNILGVFANTVKSDFFISKLSSVNVGDKGYVYLMDSKGIFVYHPEKEKINTKPEVKELEEAVANKGDSKDLKAKKLNYTFEGVEKLAAYVNIDGVNWTLVAAVPQAEVKAPLNSILKNSLFIMVIFIFLAAVIGYFISKLVVTPITQMLGSMTEISSGNLNVSMNIKSKDEFGILSNKFNEMIGKVKGLIENMHKSIKTLNTSTDELSSTSNSTAQAIEQTAATTQEIAKAVESQASDTLQVSEKINELGQQVEDIHEKSMIMKYNTDHILHMFESDKEIVENLAKFTGQSVGEVEKVSEITKKLENSSNKIGDITKVINSIAEQTNLLALNASIEAARAGESGRGFAVVAEEIRKLAEQSSNSVSQIAEIIKETQYYSLENAKTVDVMKNIMGSQSEFVKQTKDSFTAIMDSVLYSIEQITSINDAIEKINLYKNDVITSIESVTATTEEVSASVEQVSATTEEQAAMVEQLRNMIENINDLSKVLVQASSVFKV